MKINLSTILNKLNPEERAYLQSRLGFNSQMKNELNALRSKVNSFEKYKGRKLNYLGGRLSIYDQFSNPQKVRVDYPLYLLFDNNVSITDENGLNHLNQKVDSEKLKSLVRIYHLINKVQKTDVNIDFKKPVYEPDLDHKNSKIQMLDASGNPIFEDSLKERLEKEILSLLAKEDNE